MNNSMVAKVAGWFQFLGQLGAQVATTGLPTNAVGWIAMAGSLAAAIGIHASSNTDGSK